MTSSLTSPPSTLWISSLDLEAKSEEKEKEEEAKGEELEKGSQDDSKGKEEKCSPLEKL